MTFSDRPTELLARTLSSVLALGVRSRGLVSTILRATLEAHRDYFAVWSAWEPNALDDRDKTFRRIAGHDATGRFVPYWHRGSENIQLATMSGYDQPGASDWYSFARRHGQACKIDKPFLHPIGSTLQWVTSEVAPIFEQGAFVGAAGIDWVAKPSLQPDTLTSVVPVLSNHNATSEKLSLLTTREREVYYWVCQGKSNDEIALILGISANTVKNHLSPIFQKLGVENRYAAALASRPGDPLHLAPDFRPPTRV